MERLTGIAVSPGVVVGRAVVLTGHADVVRFPIPPERVDDELRGARNRRASARTPSCRRSAIAWPTAPATTWRRSSTRSC